MQSVASRICKCGACGIRRAPTLGCNSTKCRPLCRTKRSAYIYSAGADIRWVFVRVVDSDAGWSEDIDYFFRQDGTRHESENATYSRRLQTSALEVVTYYENGQVVKEKSHHHALGRGKPDSSQFNDPDAPTFLNVDELPFPEILDVWQRLA